jgi:hypothetical protein
MMDANSRDARNDGRRVPSLENCAAVTKPVHRRSSGPQKSAILLSNDESVRGICRMHVLGKSAGLALAIASLALLAGASAWIGYSGSGPSVAKDYEECADEAKTNASSDAEYSQLIMHCGERFAGRRKAGGGYAYFDFMQNRTFDIAGPNPSTEERKRIDSAYMEFLRAQRREMLSSDLAKQQADREQAALEAVPQDVGPPLVLTPRVPLPVKRPVVERSKSCEDGSLSCGWAKLSAAVRSAFASSAGTSR